MKRIYKTSLWVIGVLVGLFLILLLIVPPVTRYVIENNSEAWIGRKTKIEKIRINLLTGSVDVKELKIFEANGDTVFFRVQRFMADVNLWNLFRGVYHVEHLRIEDPFVRIIQQGDSLNFSDIMKRFSSDSFSKAADTTVKKNVKYRIDHFSLSGGKFQYMNNDFGANIEVVDMTLEVPALKWDDPELKLNYSLSLASGGDVEGTFHLNQETLGYTEQLTADSLQISFILPYLKPYLKIKQLDGTCSLTMTIDGNMNDPYRSVMRGEVDLRDFDLMGSKEQKELAFDHFSIGLDSINTFQGFANIGDVLLDGLLVREERYDSIDSFSQLIIRNLDGYTPDGKAPDSAFVIASKSNPVILLVDFIKKMQEVVVIDSFTVNELSVKNGVFHYSDYTLLEPENLTIEDLTLTITDINSSNCNTKGTFRANVESTGYIHANFTFCPFKPYDFEATYQLKNIEVVHYNQYSIFYTDYPFKEGTLYYNGSISSKNNVMKMNNNIFIKKIYLGKKVDNEVGMHLPMKLILAIVRDKEGNVFLDIPISGDLKNPKMNYWKLIGQALGNFFRKIFTSPSRQLAKEYGENEQFFKDLCFDKDQETLNSHQKHQLDKLTQVLTEKPQLVIDFRHLAYSEKADSAHQYIMAHRFKKWSRLISDYLTPFLDDPVNRFTFSVKEKSSGNESSKKSEKKALCYELGYSVRK
ncbi:MAG: DUF748 domain-containing protein [Bacteroidales bacterium]|nr:DUF748 domain-containing protein [Bacteroidales bacterium]